MNFDTKINTFFTLKCSKKLQYLAILHIIPLKDKKQNKIKSNKTKCTGFYRNKFVIFLLSTISYINIKPIMLHSGY